MKRAMVKLTAILLLLAMTVSFTACGGGGGNEEKTVDAKQLLQSLLTGVTYECELTLIEDDASLYFPDLPEATVTMYDGDGYYADELVLITLTDAADAEAGMVSVKEHVKELRAQFLSYVPAEVSKIDNAVIWSQGASIILCVTNDYENAQNTIDNPPSLADQPGNTSGDTTGDTSDDTTGDTSDDTTDPPVDTSDDPTDAPTEDPAKAYYTITSQSGKYKNYDGVYLIDNMAYEGYNYSESAAKNYANLVNKVAAELEGTTKVYDLIIPTSIGVVLPDDMKDKINPEDQAARLEQIFAKMNDSVIPVNCFERLLSHRDEYLYFRTDWHWNGPGAYYAYEEFCQVKGITPYTMEQRQVMEFGNYLGGLYQNNCKKDSALSATPDTVVAYLPYSSNATMKFTDVNGKTYAWDIITDVSSWNSASKYNCFAGSDQPYAEFTNPDVTDGSVLVIVKESFGNALLSYLVDHYSKVYEIDYRYWKGDLVDFCEQVGADDLLFANNIGMVRTSYLIGKLDGIIS